MATADSTPYKSKGSRTSILVVGHQGLLGQELMLRLKRLGPVSGVDRGECDIRNPSQVEQVLDRFHPQWLVNAAADTDVDGCESNQRLAWEVNARGAGNLARACSRQGITIVQLSTDFIFDGQKKEPYTEEDIPHPLSVYGETKLAGEEEVQRSSGSYLIVRTAWLFGKGGKNFPDAILKLARTSDSISIISDQVGSPTYAVDLAQAIGTLIEQDSRGVVNVTNQGSCSWYEYALFILKTAGLDTKVNPISSPELNRAAARPVYSVLSHRRYKSMTGQSLRTWPEAVNEYINEKLSISN